MSVGQSLWFQGVPSLSSEPEERGQPGRKADSVIRQVKSRDPESEVRSSLRAQRSRDKGSGSKTNMIKFQKDSEREFKKEREN